MSTICKYLRQHKVLATGKTLYRCIMDKPGPDIDKCDSTARIKPKCFRFKPRPREQTKIGEDRNR